MTEAQAEKLAAADEAFEKWWPPKKPFEGYWTSREAQEMAKEVWDARQAEVEAAKERVAGLTKENEMWRETRDRLAAENADCEATWLEARTEADKLAKENAELKAGKEDAQFLHGEMRQLRELAGELVEYVSGRGDGRGAALLAKAKALGIGGEG